MRKEKFYRGHCVNDEGKCCKHIKPYPGDDPDDQNTMGCCLGENNCPYVEEDDNEHTD